MTRLRGRRQATLAVAAVLLAVLLAAVVTSFIFPRPPPPQPATLSVTGTLDAADDSTTFRGQAEMRGRTEGSTFEGVEVQFHAADGTRLRTVAIGTLTATGDDPTAWRRPVNATFTESPRRITVSYASFSNAADRPVEVVGLELRNGRLVPVTTTPT